MKIQIRGLTAEVETIIVPGAEPLVDVRAACGSSVAEHRIVFDDPNAFAMQKHLDSIRQQMAEEAVKKEESNLLIGGLQ